MPIFSRQHHYVASAASDKIHSLILHLRRAIDTSEPIVTSRSRTIMTTTMSCLESFCVSTNLSVGVVETCFPPNDTVNRECEARRESVERGLGIDFAFNSLRRTRHCVTTFCGEVIVFYAWILSQRLMGLRSYLFGVRGFMPLSSPLKVHYLRHKILPNVVYSIWPTRSRIIGVLGDRSLYLQGLIP